MGSKQGTIRMGYMYYHLLDQALCYVKLKGCGYNHS